MPRTARVKFPASVLLEKLGLPEGAKIIGAEARYEGRVVLFLDHPGLMDHSGMRPPFVDPHYGDSREEFRWDQKPIVLMGQDGVEKKRADVERRRKLEGK